jgi:hypothetical protein
VLLRSQNNFKQRLVDRSYLNQRGLTLIQVAALFIVLVVLVLTIINRCIDWNADERHRVTENVILELNNREFIAWWEIKVSASGWIKDMEVFAEINTDLGKDYSWHPGPTIFGGTLHFGSLKITLKRSPSTNSSAAKWHK